REAPTRGAGFVFTLRRVLIFPFAPIRATAWRRTSKMAATTFKQQCPSCEALVPIRDPKLIGRKIDCPKCQYRFGVEEPAGDEDEAERGGRKNGKAQQAVTARRRINAKGPMAKTARLDDEDDASEDRPAPVKKGGSSTTLILGIGLGAVA